MGARRAMAASLVQLLSASLVLAAAQEQMGAQEYQISGQEYQIGAGIADATGPAAEVTFMGYARLEQKGGGIHLRQFSRAFILDDGTSRLLFVSVDCAMVSYGLRKEVLERLSRRFGALYSEQNVILSGTHTHSAPGGFNQYLLYDISVLGFVRQTFEALAAGIVRSVERAHAAVGPGRLFWSRGELLDANMNRSPSAYLKNPEEERARFAHDVDKEMVQLRLVRPGGRAVGAISWFAVHPTSMNNTNTLVSGDNVGVAALLLERRMDPEALPGKGSFVGAFAASNLGDVSPNLRGPHCTDTGETCDLQTSTCDGANVLCVAAGPGRDMFESTRTIGERLFGKALELLEAPGTPVSGPVRSVHQYVDMTRQKVSLFDREARTNVTMRGCLPAMGYSFAAGTTDGPGAFTFVQGMTSPNELWNAVRDFLVTPSTAESDCQGAKPILIPTGEMKFPFEWQPRVVSTGVAAVGGFTIVAVPGEFSTMAGRRLREAVRTGLKVTDSKVAVKWGDASEGEPVVIAGLCNTYSSYIVTPEEYSLQRYEAASTIFGPHTLPLYEHQYGRLAAALASGARLKPGTPPRDLKEELVSLVAPVIFDSAPWGRKFGECVKQPPVRARPGDLVAATFVSGHPRNNLLQEDSFMTVERRAEASAANGSDANLTWSVVATDANWETKYVWYRTSFLLGTSESRLEWEVPEGTVPGWYRLRHKGHAKYLFGGVFPYSGSSRNFQVLPTSRKLARQRTSG